MLGPKMASRGQWSFAAVFGGLLTQAVFNTTARLLRSGGLETELPAHRVKDLQIKDEWRQHFETIDPSRPR